MLYLCMHDELKRLQKLKIEQKAKSEKDKIINSYIDSSRTLEDKIAAVKLKHSVDKSAFVSSIKKLLNKK